MLPKILNLRIFHISAFYSENNNFGASQRFKNLVSSLDDANEHIIIAPNFISREHKVLYLPKKIRIFKTLLIYFYTICLRPKIVVSDLLPSFAYKATLIYLIHDVRVSSKYAKKGIKSSKLLYSRILRRADRVITVSNFSKSELKPFFNGKIDVVHNGVSKITPRPQIKHSRKGLIYIAKFERRKNIKRYFELCNEYYKVTGEISVLVSDYNEALPKSCHLLSTITKEELYCRLHSSKYYVSTSEYEGFGIPLVEAYVCGCNLAVSNIGAHVEVIQKLKLTNSLLFDLEDENTLIVDSISKLDYDLKVNFPECFIWENLSKDYCRVLNCVH